MKCDAKTFARMYEKVYQDLYRFALCLLKNRQEAEDAVSEAVTRAYENIHKLRSEEAFRSWIFTILSNICRKKWQSSLQERQNLEESMYVQEPLEQVDCGLAVDVRNAFFILTEEEQMIVGLSVLGGYNSMEIGRILKLNASTVRSKRSRALAKMKCVLE